MLTHYSKNVVIYIKFVQNVIQNSTKNACVYDSTVQTNSIEKLQKYKSGIAQVENVLNHAEPQSKTIIVSK